MKIIICGKGGSGKSTISTLLARALSNRGYNILVVDGDESNVGLHRLLGGTEPIIFMDNLGGKKGFKEKINTAFPKGNTDAILRSNSTINDIPKECIAEIDGIKLLAIGKIHDAGEGCACPIGMLSKTVLSKLVLKEKDVMIIDAEAGVEHFGRGIDAGCDMILCVVDPSFESFMLARKMQGMALKAEKEISFILNKVDDKVLSAMNANIDPQKVIARIPTSADIFMDSLEGRKIGSHIPEIEDICRFIETKKQK